MKNINTIIKVCCLVMLALFNYNTSSAQLNGTYTIGGASPDYSTLSSAISALNSNGVNGPVDFVIRDGVYTGNSWRGIINNVNGASATNTITFRSQSGNKANVVLRNNSSSNYIFRFNNSKYITVKDMTFEKYTTSYHRIFDFGSTQASYITIDNCVLMANATRSSSTSRVMIYAYGHRGTDNTIKNCEFKNGNSFIYWRGSGTGTTSRSNNLIITNNKFTSASNSGYYGIYTYYTNNLEISDNELTRTGSSTYYPLYNYYSYDAYKFTDNKFDVTTTGYIYYYQYRINYVSNSSADVTITGNDIKLKTTSGRVYFYTRYLYNMTNADNNITINTTTGYKYVYNSYYCYNSEIHDNNIEMTSSSSGRTYFYDLYNGTGSKSYDNIYTSNNKNGISYIYLAEYGSSNEMYGNTITANMTSGYIYSYAAYNWGGSSKFHDNTMNINSTSGSIYGVRHGYNVGEVYNNKFDFRCSGYGTIYGMYPYYMNGGKIYNNTYFVNTRGSVYNMYAYYCTGGTIMNNTLHSESTSSGGYLLYNYNRNSGSNKIKNNIFSRKTAGSNMVWYYNGGNTESDYNLFYTPGTEKYYSNTNPSTSKNNLHDWRKATNGNDRNSIFFKPAYANAPNGDLHIDATSASAWAINGRAEHDTTVKTDLDATARPIIVADGVPDIGAYEVMPTSTPPNATAIPANPVANTTQYFLFAQDTVATIDWGATVPTTYTMRQYTGTQAGPIPTGVGRMYFYTAGTPSTYVHNYTPNIYYKDPWIGDIPGENEAVIARSSNGGAWEGYNYSNASTNTARNILSSAASLDSIGGYTGVQNGRIGIRCVEDPMNLKITNITAFAADVDWNPVFNPIGYQVVLKKIDEAPTQTEWNSASLPTTNSIALGGLEEDTKYYLFVRSICGVKDTSGYTADSFTTLITCHTPDVKVTGVNDTRVVAYWNDIKTAVKYEYVLTNSSATPDFGTDLNKTSVLNTILDDDKEYFVHVRAHCSSIYTESNWASTSFKTWRLGIGDVSGDGVKMNIYPNPVHNEMTVTVGEVKGVGTLTLMDMTGKVLKVMPVSTSKVTVQTGDLPAGTYIAQFADDANRQQVKFNKQ